VKCLGYDLDDRGINSRLRQQASSFSSAFKPSLRSIQAPTLWVPGLERLEVWRWALSPILSRHYLKPPKPSWPGVELSRGTNLLSAAVQQAERICCHILQMFWQLSEPEAITYLLLCGCFSLPFSHESIYVYASCPLSAWSYCRLLMFQRYTLERVAFQVCAKLHTI
jgi:hypothetical protein